MANEVKCLDCGDKKLSLEVPAVMGILNVTPDSFSDGGSYLHTRAAIARALEMVEQGAQIIDVGGESTRPGAEPVSVQDELDRVIPIVEALVREVDTVVSVDTSKPQVMAEAIASGCHIINDVKAFREEGAIEAVAKSNVGLVLMHMFGEPRTMQENPVYHKVGLQVGRFLIDRVKACLSAGIDQSRIAIDPGFGFGKALEHNIELFNDLRMIGELGIPVMVGVSRKSMLGAILGKPVGERLVGSVTLAAFAAAQGASILRVHDVAETVDAIKVLSALRANIKGAPIGLS